MGRLALALTVAWAVNVPLAVMAQTAEELVASGAVEIRTRVVPQASILVGQKVSLWVEVLTNTWFPQPPRFPDSLEAADTIVLPSSSGTSFVDRRGRETYAGIARRYDLYPLRPGRIATPVATVSVVVALDSGGRSPEMAMMTEPQSVEVDLPEGARGLGLVVASPGITVEDSLGGDPVSKRVGESLRRTVSTRVEDSVSMLLPGPDLWAPEGVASYPETPRFSDRSERGKVSGERIDEVTYLFEQEGEFILPEQQIHWWDTSADRLRTEVLAAVEITVDPNPELAEERFGDADEEATLEVEPIVAAPPSDERWKRLSAIVLGGAAVLWLVLWWIRRRSSGSAETPIDPHATEAAAFDRLRESLRGSSRAETYRHLLDWLGCLGETVGIVSWRDLARRTGDEVLAREIGELENELFGGAPAGARGSSVRALEGRLTEARRAVLRQSEGRQRSSGLPSRLNPAFGR